jgi:hypothetical protein
MKTTRIEVKGTKGRANIARREVAGADEGQLGLFDALRENLSPQAVAAMATYLMAGKTACPEVSRELAWFTNRLVEMLGGAEALDRTAKEAGL